MSILERIVTKAKACNMSILERIVTKAKASNIRS